MSVTFGPDGQIPEPFTMRIPFQASNDASIEIFRRQALARTASERFKRASSLDMRVQDNLMEQVSLRENTETFFKENPLGALPKLDAQMMDYLNELMPARERAIIENLQLPLPPPKVLEHYALSNLEHFKIAGDGNCLYRSLAWWKYGTVSAHARVRNELCNKLEEVMNNPHNYPELFELMQNDVVGLDDLTYDTPSGYDFSKCKEPGAWGNAFTIVLACLCYHTAIMVVSTRGHDMRFTLINNPDDPTSSEKLWWIFHHKHEGIELHYSVLAPKRALKLGQETDSSDDGLSSEGGSDHDYDYDTE
jgi:hypothetical protein